MAGPRFHEAKFDQLSARVLYALLRLRSAVFVVEQHCAYQDLDDRDTHPGTRHLWLADEAAKPGAYLRVIEDPGAIRIGRVVTAAPARRRGLAGTLIEKALAGIGDQPVVLDAQSAVWRLYAKYGFTVAGDEFDEDGIPHIPMIRPQRSGRTADADC